MKQKTTLLLTAGALAMLVFGAGATAMVMSDEAKESAQVSEVSHNNAEQIHWNNTQSQQRAAAPQQPACDDDNIVGKVAGGVIGGVAGSQIGSGSGKTAATIGGSVGGTLLGEEYIPTRNATCAK